MHINEDRTDKEKITVEIERWFKFINTDIGWAVEYEVSNRFSAHPYIGLCKLFIIINYCDARDLQQIFALRLTISWSSAKLRSYSLSATIKIIDVTPSKQWIHFFLSDRWPPMSNILPIKISTITLRYTIMINAPTTQTWHIIQTKVYTRNKCPEELYMKIVIVNIIQQNCHGPQNVKY